MQMPLALVLLGTFIQCRIDSLRWTPEGIIEGNTLRAAQVLPTVKESRFYKNLIDDRVECGTCERRCVVPVGKEGFCRTRRNIEGNLVTLVYGDISSISANPIEKKPFFHFWPGSYALTVGTWGCNFQCPWCQNWEISKHPPSPEQANYVSPERLVELALEEKC